MTEARLFEIVQSFDLVKSVQRVTTGTDKSGFNEYEFSGDYDNLKSARDLIDLEWYAPKFVTIQICDNIGHKDYGKPYLLVTSFYVDRSNPKRKL